MIHIVISHNVEADISPCLKSLYLQSFQDFETVLVIGEGASKPGEEALAYAPEAHVMEQLGIRWWAESANQGIEYAMQKGTKFVLLLDSDVILPTDFIENMIYWGRRKPLAVMGGLEIDRQTGRGVYGGEREVGTLGHTQSLISYLPADEWGGLQPVSIFAGKAIWVPSVVFERVGLFDAQNFPHFMAALDFSRALRNKGFELYANMDARLCAYKPSEEVFRRQKSIQNFARHLFNVEGQGNLKYFTKYIVKNYSQVWILLHLAGGYTRRLVGYWIK